MGETTKREREKAVIAIKPCLSPNRLFWTKDFVDCRFGFFKESYLTDMPAWGCCCFQIWNLRGPLGALPLTDQKTYQHTPAKLETAWDGPLVRKWSLLKYLAKTHLLPPMHDLWIAKNDRSCSLQGTVTIETHLWFVINTSNCYSCPGDEDVKERNFVGQADFSLCAMHHIPSKTEQSMLFKILFHVSGR